MASDPKNLAGLGDVIARLQAVGKAGKRALRAGVTKAARKLARRAKGAAVKKSGLLKKSIGQKVTAKKDGLVVTAKVGPRRGMKADVTRDGRTVTSDPVRYAHLVEQGTVRSRAQPFLAPAWAGGREEAEAIIAAEAEKAIAKAAGG